MVKKYVYFTIIITLVIVFALFIVDAATNESEMEMRLEVIAGNSLFNVWSNYDAIQSNSTGELTIESIIEINKNLSLIEIYSKVIDTAVGQELLYPIASNLVVISSDIEGSYYENGGFSELDEKKYKKVIVEVNNIIPLLYKSHYDPNSIEGGNATLEIKDFDELVALNNQLIDYITSHAE